MAIWLIFQSFVYEDNISEAFDSFIYILHGNSGMPIFIVLAVTFSQASKNHSSNMLTLFPKAFARVLNFKSQVIPPKLMNSLLSPFMF